MRSSRHIAAQRRMYHKGLLFQITMSNALSVIRRQRLEWLAIGFDPRMLVK